MFFADEQTLYVGKISLERFGAGANARTGAAVKWLDESVGCAHLYFDGGPKLGSEEIAEVRKFERSDGQSWEEVLGSTQWLEL